MIDVRQAVQAAVEYVNSFPGLLRTSDVRLEETDYDDKVGEFRVTLSFSENPVIGSRSYKVFRVDGEGRVTSMKARSALG